MFEILKEIWSFQKLGDLSIHVMDGFEFMFALICLQNVEELLVDRGL